MKQLLILLFMVNSLMMFAQPKGGYTTKSKKAIAHHEKALEYYNQYKNEETLKEISKSLQQDSAFIESWMLLASLYTDMKQPLEAIAAYQKAIEVNPEFYHGVYLTLGDLEYKNGLYFDAEKHLDIYLSDPDLPAPKKKAAVELRKKNDIAIGFAEHPVPFKPINLGPNVNSENDEYLPAITADEQTLIITVRRPRDQYTLAIDNKFEEDFYISHKENGEWTKAVFAGAPLNTHGNEGAQCISPDGQYLYFTGCNRPGGMGSCDIYVSRKIGDRWSQPKNIGYPLNTESWESQPSISPDGKTLYFSSNRKGTKGSMDIWKCVLNQDGSANEPVNLGDSVNTPGMEAAPFIHPDGQTLYFASNGHPGLGGMDLFYTRMLDTSWGKPVNIGYPINTCADEINLLVNAKGNFAYIASDKLGGYGKFDLYGFELYPEARPLAVTYLKGKVYDKDTRHPLEASFNLIDLNDGEIIASSSSDPSNGEFLVCIPANRNYALNVSKEAYLFYSDNFSLAGDYNNLKPFEKDIPLQEIKVGQSVVLKNIFYETDRFDLKPESMVELDKLVELLKHHPSMKIEISGHTDNVGTDKYNQTLSENRAKSVYQYLLSKGISATRLSFKGYGFSNPIDTNDTLEGRANNRRTEFKVVGV